MSLEYLRHLVIVFLLVCVSAKLRALRALVLYVLSCFICLILYVLLCFKFLVLHVSRALCGLVPRALCALFPYVTYCLVPCVLYVLISPFVLFSFHALRTCFSVHLLIVIFWEEFTKIKTNIVCQ